MHRRVSTNCIELLDLANEMNLIVIYSYITDDTGCNYYVHLEVILKQLIKNCFSPITWMKLIVYCY